MVLALLGPAATAVPAQAIQAGGQVVSASAGVATNNSWTTFTDPQGGTRRFLASFYAPSGSVTGTDPVGPGVLDMRKPFAYFASSPVSGSSSGGCITMTNPTSYDLGVPGSVPQALTDVYFDVKCNDGSGFQFYRVRWVETPGYGYDLNHGLLNLPGGDPGGGYYVTPQLREGFYGNGVFFSAAYQTKNGEPATLQVCGYDGASFHCSPLSGLTPSQSAATLWPVTRNWTITQTLAAGS
jgi:hypothetical protein